MHVPTEVWVTSCELVCMREPECVSVCAPLAVCVCTSLLSLCLPVILRDNVSAHGLFVGRHVYVCLLSAGVCVSQDGCVPASAWVRVSVSVHACSVCMPASEWKVCA